MTVPSQPKYKVNDRVRIRQVLKTSNRHVMINGKYVSAKIRKEEFEQKLRYTTDNSADFNRLPKLKNWDEFLRYGTCNK